MTIKMYNSGNKVLLSHPWSTNKGEDYRIVLLNGSYAFNATHTTLDQVKSFAVSANTEVLNRQVSKNSLGVYLTHDPIVFGGITAVYAVVMCSTELVFFINLNAGKAFTFTSRAKLTIDWLIKTSQETLNLCPLPEIPDPEPEPQPEPEPEVPVIPDPDPVPEPEPPTPEPEPEPEPEPPEPEPQPVVPVINSVGGDNRIDINEKDINIAGSELADVYQVAVVGSGKTVQQAIKAKGATFIKFDLSGITIAGTYQVLVYKLNGTNAAKQVTIVAVAAVTTYTAATIKEIKETIAKCKGGEKIIVSVNNATFAQGENRSPAKEYGRGMAFKEVGQHLKDYVTVEFTGGVDLNQAYDYVIINDAEVGKRVDGFGRGSCALFFWKSKYIHIKGLNMFDSKPYGNTGLVFEKQTGSRTAGVMEIESSYIMLDGMRISNCGTYGIMGYNAEKATVKDCKVFDIGQEAIEFMPDKKLDGTMGHTLNGFHILNNELYQTGRDAAQRGEAIYMGFGSMPHTGFMTDVKIIGNNIHDTKEEAIDIKTSVRDVEILDNNIKNVELGNSGNGAITVDTDNFTAWDDYTTGTKVSIKTRLLYKTANRFIIKGNRIENITNTYSKTTAYIRVGAGTGIITENTLVGHTPAKSYTVQIAVPPIFQNSLAKKVYVYNNTYVQNFGRAAAYNIWGSAYNGLTFPAEIFTTAPPSLPVLPVVESYYPSTLNNVLMWYEGMNFETGGPDVTKTLDNDITVGFLGARTQRWRDRSGNGYHLVATVLANFGSFTQYYSGVNTQKQLLATTNGNPLANKVCSVFAVVSSDAATQTLGYYFGTLGAVNNQSLFVGSRDATTYGFGVDATFGTVNYTETKGKRFIIQLDFTLSNITANIDGVTGSVADVFTGNQNFCIGGGFSDADNTRRHTNSNIFELFALNNPTTLQKTNARTYLTTKWGIT